MTSNRVDFIVPFQYLELLKTNLKTGKKINKSRAIAPVSTSSGQSGEIEYAIPTLYLEHEVAGASAKYDEIGLGHIFGAVTVATERASIDARDDKRTLLKQLVYAWLQILRAK